MDKLVTEINNFCRFVYRFGEQFLTNEQLKNFSGQDDCSGVNVIKLFFYFVSNAPGKLARAFVIGDNL